MAGQSSNSSTLLSVLKSGSLTDIAARMAFWKGLQLGVQGEPCPHLYIVATGQVLLRRRNSRGEECALYLLGPGDLFGEGSLLPGGEWIFSAQAVTDGMAYTLRAAQLPHLAQYHPEITAHLVRLLASRLQQAHERGDLVTKQGARERLLGLLALMAEYHGEPRGEEVWVSLTVTQEQLGEMIGLARETVARTISGLESEGVVRHVRRRGFWLRIANLGLAGVLLSLPTLTGMAEALLAGS